MPVKRSSEIRSIASLFFLIFVSFSLILDFLEKIPLITLFRIPNGGGIDLE